MASRSGGGAIAFAVFLGVLWLVFFVLTLAFYGQINGLKADAADAEKRLAKFVSGSERDKADRLAEAATAQGKTVFGLLESHLGDTMETVTGSPNTTTDQLSTRVQALSSSDPLLQQLQASADQIAQLNQQLETAVAARTLAEKNYNDQKKAVDDLRRELSGRQDQLQRTVEDYSGRAQNYLTNLEAAEKNYRDDVERLRTQAETDRNRLQSRINELAQGNLMLEGQIASLRAENRADLLKPKDEFALVDGTVIAIDGTERTVTIDRGRRDKVVLDMTFAVYGDAASIRPNSEGEYPPGKASLVVINVQETSSTCRVVRQSQGNQIVRGDVIANALYDANKKYRFLVFGNFDVDGDGRDSEYEREGVEAKIRDWSGEIVPDLTGDVDFVVLGSRPIVPIRPGSNAPPELQVEWVRRSQVADKYDEYQRRAEATSIPILNWNRLRTLCGL